MNLGQLPKAIQNWIYRKQKAPFLLMLTDSLHEGKKVGKEVTIEDDPELVEKVYEYYYKLIMEKE